MIRFLKNPTNEDITFMCSIDYPRQEHTVLAGEVKAFPEAVVDHCVKSVNNDLVEISEDEYLGDRVEEAVQEKVSVVVEDKPITLSVNDIDELAWRELQKVAKEYGVYQFGMRRVDAVEAV